MHRSQSRLLVVLAVSILAPIDAGAKPVADARADAILWLERSQNQDGSWGSGARAPLATAEALLALATAERGSGVRAQRAGAWLRTRELAAVDFRARRIRALATAGEHQGTAAAALDAVRGQGLAGWGLVSAAGASALDTALALDALAAAGHALAPSVADALAGAVILRRREDHGWSGDGIPAAAGASDLATTAEVARALAGKTSPAAMGWGALVVSLLLGAWLVQRLRSHLVGFVSRQEFGYWIHCLITVKENGGTLTIVEPKSRAMVRIERSAGDSESNCELFMDIPRTSWSETMLETIVEFFETRNLPHSEPMDRSNVILRVRFRIDDIWDDASGASVARTAQDLFDFVGISRKARYRLQTAGVNSLRLYERKAPAWLEGNSGVLRAIAKKVSRNDRSE